MEWLNNAWVVGIGGGVLSGLLVTVVSRTLLSRRDRREYVQKLLSANREVIYAIRPGVSEGHVPERRIVKSLINATARKYAVDKSDLYDPTQVGEELTKEIMDSSFISASTKQQYCDQLESLAPAQAELGHETTSMQELQTTSKSDMAEYRSRMVTMMSGMLGVMTATTTAVLVFSEQFGTNILGSESTSLTFLVPMVVALASMVMMTMLTFIRREYRLKSGKRAAKIVIMEDPESVEQGGKTT